MRTVDQKCAFALISSGSNAIRYIATYPSTHPVPKAVMSPPQKAVKISAATKLVSLTNAKQVVVGATIQIIQLACIAYFHLFSIGDVVFCSCSCYWFRSSCFFTAAPIRQHDRIGFVLHQPLTKLAAIWQRGLAAVTLTIWARADDLPKFNSFLQKKKPDT